MSLLLFSLDPDDGLVTALSNSLREPIAPHEDRAFEDGEHKVRPLVDPRGSDAYVVASLHGGPVLSPHDKLCRLLLFVATLREHGADRVTAVVPYLAYARKDRQTKPFDPVALRYVAQLFEAVGTSQVLVLEAHNVAAFQNAFRCPSVHLESHRAFDAVADHWAAGGPIAVASPDPGGVKRALLWREHLQERLAQPVGFAMIDKRRSGGVVSSANLVAGDVEGLTVLLFDDLIASGETMRRAAVALRGAGAREIVAVAAHGLFVGAAAEVLADEQIAQVAVTDSVPSFRLPAEAAVARKLRRLTAAPLFAQAIREGHERWRRR
jgi:ribose-phosphate pyrophosphokinase